ncbi:MAG TPA: ferritin-like domain-containing protein [Chloroflexota bacterium]|nr:ferritin-like domain-containing protein [Chloroflexota bacterium]
MTSDLRHGLGTSTTGRRQFLKGAAATGIGLALAGSLPLKALAAAGTTTDTVQSIINTALIAEQLATTFYYTGLTTPAIINTPNLAGKSGSLNSVGSDGNAGNVAYFQAALDQENKHAAALAKAGAMSSQTGFYFPGTTFQSIGYTSQVGTFLWVLDHLETAFIGAYLAAVNSFGTLGHADLAQLAGQILGVESEHRALGRVVAGDDPANNVTLEVASFTAVGQAGAALAPYLTGKGFTGGVTSFIPLPTQAQIITAVGTNASS